MTQTIPVFAPFDLELISEITLHTEAEVEGLLNRGYALAHRLKPFPKHQRIDFLERVNEVLKKKAPEFVQLIAREGGKPVKDAQVEVQRAIEAVRTSIGALHQWHGHEVPMGLNETSSQILAFTRREPRGLVLAISAFNHPLLHVVHQVIPALAIGCPVLIKPSLKTPLTCQLFVDLLKECELPEDWCQILLTHDGLTEKLASDPRIAVLSFIGSSTVGWRLRSKVAPGVHTLLEHGGTAPVVICEDAQIEASIKALTRGAFYHAGQVPVSVQNIFVHSKVMRNFTEQMVAAAESMRVGDPLDAATDIGPLIHPKEVERVERWIEDAVAKGAQVALKGMRSGKTCLSPTILCEAPFNTPFYEEEIFGPAVGIYSFHELETVLARINNSRFAFQASIYTQNIDRGLRFMERVHAGAVMINESAAFRADWMPSSSLKHSGQGVRGVLPSMMELSYEKLVVTKSSSLMP
ncbi:MAG: aldehyde dehydrogenase family protein [Proteobacteria bacterium]|nr:MAG: aldehyde dehydrogenase family protein [Pseudomonadota bacterium]